MNPETSPTRSAFSTHPVLGGPDSIHLFDRAFLIEPIPSPKRHYRARISTGFTGVPGRPIGSYVLAIVLRCLLHAAGDSHPDPLALHANFFASPAPGSFVEIELVERRKGRALLFMDAHVIQGNFGKGEELVVSAHAVLGTFPEGKQMLGERYHAPPPIPPPEQCIDVWRALLPGVKRPPHAMGDVDRDEATSMLGDPAVLAVACKPHLADADLGDCETIMSKSVGPVWMFHPDGRGVDSVSLCFFADQPPPTNVFMMNRARPAQGLPVLMPSTVSLSIHFHAKTAGKLVINRSQAGVIQAGSVGRPEGKFDNEILLWDEGGALVCSSRQIVHGVSMDGKGGLSGKDRMFGPRASVGNSL